MKKQKNAFATYTSSLIWQTKFMTVMVVIAILLSIVLLSCGKVAISVAPSVVALVGIIGKGMNKASKNMNSAIEMKESKSMMKAKTMAKVAEKIKDDVKRDSEYVGIIQYMKDND